LSLDGGADGRMTVAMSRSENQMLLLTDGLSNPPSGHDYQVWAGHDGSMVSAGFLTPEGGDARLAVSDFGNADQIAVTVEPDGGSPQPTQSPVMSVDLPV
jgi:anti-sigma-K factor RskA